MISYFFTCREPARRSRNDSKKFFIGWLSGKLQGGSAFVFKQMQM